MRGVKDEEVWVSGADDSRSSSVRESGEMEVWLEEMGWGRVLYRKDLKHV